MVGLDTRIGRRRLGIKPQATEESIGRLSCLGFKRATSVPEKLDSLNLHHLHYDLRGYIRHFFRQPYRKHSLLKFGNDFAALNECR